MTPEEIARRYFGRMRDGAPVDDLFTPDAELRGLGNRVVGRAAIAEFYGRAQQDARPRPEPVAIAGAADRALAEARIFLADGTVMHVVDVFEIDGELIKSLTYFVSDYPTDPSA